MFASTLWPGSWPPSPGLAPCAILIWMSSALTRYSAVTPKRPDATCLIAERIESPFGSGLKRSASSPPSPVLELAADAVHGDGQRGVRLAADRAEAHGAGGEALDDLDGRLRPRPAAPASRPVLNSIRPRRVSRRSFWSLIVLGEELVLGRSVAAHRVLQLATRSPASRHGPRRAGGRHSRRRRPACCDRSDCRHRRRGGGARFLGDLLQADAFDGGGGAGEVLLDEVAATGRPRRRSARRNRTGRWRCPSWTSPSARPCRSP